jgi:hypothetical protein
MYSSYYCNFLLENHARVVGGEDEAVAAAPRTHSLVTPLCEVLMQFCADPI